MAAIKSFTETKNTSSMYRSLRRSANKIYVNIMENDPIIENAALICICRASLDSLMNSKIGNKIQNKQETKNI